MEDEIISVDISNVKQEFDEVMSDEKVPSELSFPCCSTSIKDEEKSVKRTLSPNQETLQLKKLLCSIHSNIKSVRSISDRLASLFATLQDSIRYKSYVDLFRLGVELDLLASLNLQILAASEQIERKIEDEKLQLNMESSLTIKATEPSQSKDSLPLEEYAIDRDSIPEVKIEAESTHKMKPEIDDESLSPSRLAFELAAAMRNECKNRKKEMEEFTDYYDEFSVEFQDLIEKTTVQGECETILKILPNTDQNSSNLVEIGATRSTEEERENEQS